MRMFAGSIATVSIVASLASWALATPRVTEPAPALVSNGGTLHSFSDALNLPLKTDADFGRFVDPQIVGADRALAITLLRLEPANKRGDFVYLRDASHILTNRLAYGAGLRFLPGFSKQKRSRPRAGGRMHYNSYPPTGGENGPYIRTYSLQGINAAYGYATAPCDVNLLPGDSGNMYFNAYNGGGSDIVDAGIGANNTSRSYPGLTAQQTQTAFLNPLEGPTWSNQSNLYPCGVSIGIMYGTLPPNMQATSMLAVGLPAYDPTQMNLPPETTEWTTASWNFFPTNAALLQGGGTWNGVPSNCTLCSVAQMVTIATRNPQPDGSCFGYCINGFGGEGRWDEVVAGQLVPNCDQVPHQSFECTIDYITTWSPSENDFGSGIAYNQISQQQYAEGIDYGSLANTHKTLLKFPAPPLPDAPTTSCPPDSDNLCAIQNSEGSGDNGYNCQTGEIGGKPTYVYGYNTAYYVFSGSVPSELQGSTEYVVKYAPDGEGGCTQTASWAPWEPSKHFSDPNLP